MSKVFLIVIMLFSLNGFSQDWAPVGATWHYTYNVFFSPDSGSTKFEVVSDTIISGKLCSKITEQVSFDNGRPNVEYTYIENDTVFFYDISFAEFQILYDFNSGPGDIWFIKFDNDYPAAGDIDSIKVLVDSIDFIVINSVALKRMFVTYQNLGESTVFSDSYQGVIVERLGDLQMMFNFFSFDNEFVDGVYSKGLRCYDDLILGHYDSPGISQCVFMSEVEKYTFTEAVIYPNPTSEKINFIGDAESYMIYTIDGRLIQNGILDGEDYINVESLTKGLYTIQIITAENQTYKTTFVKQ